jgi:RNA polymerase sigma factor (sigma-70 family)
MTPSEEGSRDVRLEAIFRAHFADLYRYIYRQIRDAVVAEDLTSAVFLKALRWLQQDRSQESVKGWLYATARSTIADYWRERAQMPLLALEEVEEIPLLSDESDEQAQPLQMRLQHLLAGLSSRERDVLTLRYFQGYSAAEIGQVLGLSANHVRVLQLRALRRAARLEAEERIVPMESPTTPYDRQASRVLELAKDEARSFNHNYIGTEHLLLGILREGSAAAELTDLGITLEGMRGGILFLIGREDGAPAASQDFTPRTKQVLILSGEEAQRTGETAISPHHILIALMREGQGIAAQMLQVSGIRLEQVGNTVHIIKVPAEIEEEAIALPADFQAALQQHPAANTFFEKLSSSKKKKFIDYIEQAEGEAARRQHVQQIIAQLEKISQAHQS